MNIRSDPAERNLSLLSRFQSAAAKGLLDHLRVQRIRNDVSPYRIETGESGAPSLIKMDGEKPVWLHDPNTPGASAQHLARAFVSDPPGMVLIWSCGLGYLPCALANFLGGMKIIVLEPDYDLLFEALRIHNWEPLLRSPDFLLLTGEHAVEEIREILNRYGSLLKKGFKILPGRNLLDSEQWRFDDLKRYAGEYIKRHQSKKAPSLTLDETQVVIASADAHQELAPILCKEAKAVGIRTRPTVRRASITRFIRNEEMGWEMLGKPLPGAILAFSERVFLPEEWARFGEAGIQRILWLYDDPFRSSVDEWFFERVDAIFCFDPYLTEKLRDMSDTPVMYLPAAASFTGDFKGKELINVPTPLDIVFVGSTGFQRQDDRMIHLVTSGSKAYSTIRSFVYSFLSKGERVPYDELIGLSLEFPGFDESARMVLIQDLATFVTRTYYLSALINSPTRIFGDRGWAESTLSGPICALYAGEKC